MERLLHRATLSIAAACVALLAASVASAGVARHERVNIKEVKKGGEVVGIKVKLTVIPEGQHLVRIGLSPMGTPKADDYQTARNSGGVWLQAKDGKLPHQLAEIKFTEQKPVSKEFTVLYKDVPNLGPTTQFQVVTAFNQSSSYWHVFGITGVPGAQPTSYKAPGTAKAAKKPTKAKSTAARLRNASPAKANAKKPAKKPATSRARKPKAKPRARARAR